MEKVAFWFLFFWTTLILWVVDFLKKRCLSPLPPFIESLNRIFIESLNTAEIKSYLNSLTLNLNIKDLKGLKLFQKFIEIYSDEERAKKLMLPFFVLYDFRIVSSHLLSNEKKESMLMSITERLNVEYNNYELIYKELIQKILKTNDEIISLLDNI